MVAAGTVLSGYVGLVSELTATPTTLEPVEFVAHDPKNVIEYLPVSGTVTVPPDSENPPRISDCVHPVT